MELLDFTLWTCGIITAIVLFFATVQYGHSKNLQIFLGREYWIMCFAAVISLIAIFSVEPQDHGILAAKVICACAFAGAVYSNFKKSAEVNISVMFALIQAAFVPLFVLSLAAALYKGSLIGSEPV